MKILVIVLICVLFAALIIGTILLKRFDDIHPDGLLNVDTRDPDKDYYDFVFLIPTDEIPKKKFLKIEVKTKS